MLNLAQKKIRIAKDTPTYQQAIQRLRSQSSGLISNLAFCRTYLSCSFLHPEDIFGQTAITGSVAAIFHSCEECLVSGVSRLWDEHGDEISFSLFKSYLETERRYQNPLLHAHIEEWKTRHTLLSTSTERSRVIIVRDEIYGHNLIDSVKRQKHPELANLGNPGQREYGLKNGDIFDFCEKSIVLLFDALFVAGYGRSRNFQLDFDLEFRRSSDAHLAMLSKLKE